MVSIRTLSKSTKNIETKIKEEFDPSKEKIADINDILDNRTYYVATINNLGIPLLLFGKMVQQKHPSDQIKVSRQVFNELKKDKYFYTEIQKDEQDEKKLIGVETITIPADVTHHHNLEKIIKNQQPESIKIIDHKQIFQAQKYPQLKLDRNPSIFQEDIFDYIIMLANNNPRATQKHMVVEATAGSGKTFTIEQATKLVPRNKTYVFLSFNKHIKEEFKRRRPDANALTFNGAGNTAVLNKLKRSGKINKKFEINNVNNILDHLFENKYTHFNLEEMDELRPTVRRLVSLYKATGLTKLEERNNNITVKIDVESLYNLLEEYDISTECDHSDLRMLCEDILNITFNIFTNKWNGFDFDDQIWLPTIRDDVSIEQYDFVFVDETQDLNKTQLDLAIKICRQGGSIIAVGDRNQSIYGFRGADTEAIPRIIKSLNAKVFPLSITYRCPKSHVNAIKEYARNLEEKEYTREFKESMEKFEYATTENAGYEAIEDEIIPITFNQIAEKAQGIDKIICRTNAPLIKIFFQLIKDHKKAIILGKDFGEELKNLIKKVGGNTIDQFRKRLEKWYSTKRDKLLEENKSIEKVTDQFETLNILSEDLDSMDNLRLLIKEIFEESEKSDKITLSTVHKAKGLEAKTVNDSIFVVKSYSGNIIMPSPQAKTTKSKKQENNLMYVAYTRGKNKMYIIE